LCPTGAQSLDYDRVIMPLETFKVILGKMPFVKVVHLYKSGESFLNPDIFKMIRYAADRNVKVIISTNLCFYRSDEFFANIVTSGLNRLVISLDGASQESYSHYRIGGDFDLVMSNIERLLETKERLKSKKPEIIWQFLVNRFNEHEITTAQKIASELKIKLDVRPMDISDNVPDVEFEGTINERKSYWLGTNEKYICDRYLAEHRYPLFHGVCTQLFIRPVIAAEGKVLPCCESWDRNSVFGNLLTESFETVWNNQKYLDSRARFLQKDFIPKVQTVCCKCNNFGATYSLREKLKLLINIYLAQTSWFFRM
jgi:MoaA/NifB/PqqE/SkfB family radical SAM enzyme